MRRIVRLTERDLTRIVRRVISEQKGTKDNPLGSATNRVESALFEIPKLGITSAPVAWNPGENGGEITSYGNFTHPNPQYGTQQNQPFFMECNSGTFYNSDGDTIVKGSVIAAKSWLQGQCRALSAKYCEAKKRGEVVYDPSYKCA